MRGGEGFAIARDILDSGRALAKMRAIIDAQGRHEFDPDRPDTRATLVRSRSPCSDGVVSAIDNEHLVRLARLTGAPKVRGAGVDLFRKLGETVHRGEPLYRVHAGFASNLRFARSWVAQGSGYTLGEKAAEQSVAEF